VREKPRGVRVVRYGAMGWIGEFSQKSGATYGYGTKLVIQTDRGIELGEPIGTPCERCGRDVLVPRAQLQAYVRCSGQEFCRPRAGRILRAATPQDLNEQNHLNAHLREEIHAAAELASQVGLDMKIITAEHLLGGERIVFYFAAPGRIDFRQLVRELAQRYRTRIEMRQVGARDEARLVADYEVCGRECCCRSFLKKLRPVNMKMAKLQKSTLDPSKVSGRCGRLRCCLRYEHLGYEELASRLPRVNSRVDTESGPGVVVDRQILTQLVLVQLDDANRQVAVPLEELKAVNLPPLAPQERPGNTDHSLPDEGQRRGRRNRRAGGRGELPPSVAPPRERAAAAPASADDSQANRPPEESRFVASEEPAAALPEESPPGAPVEDAPPANPNAEHLDPGVRRRRRGRRRRGRGPGGAPDAPPAATPDTPTGDE
jgi:cell fate regulator YaaT (PSP1 superfamily)